LSEAKEQIATYERFHIWELAKKMANPYEVIYTQDDQNFHPSLCIFKPLSRSFYKMIEMLDVLKFFPGLSKQLQKVRSAHVAEGPGGFIEAFLEMAGKERRQVASSHAITLKPTDNHTPGWRRATHFLQRHKEVILEFGIDGTGDIYQKGNQEAFIKAVGRPVQLFTADGGFDFSLDYSLQEKKIYHLLVCSALIGLQVLSQGGHFVLKLFDIQSQHTQILIALIGSCFKEWCLYKPSTSRPCNSERYLLCREYRGQKPEVLEMLRLIEKKSIYELYPKADGFLTSSEIAYFQKNQTEIVSLQKRALSQAKLYIESPTLWAEQFPAQFKHAIEWCSSHRMPHLQRAPNSAAVQVVVSQMSERVAALQLQRPGAGSANPLPSDPALPTLL
jgi:23S rRNA U2552 (ribose-2'-O)-methylase RlmE/FtsJ